MLDAVRRFFLRSGTSINWLAEPSLPPCASRIASIKRIEFQINAADGKGRDKCILELGKRRRGRRRFFRGLFLDVKKTAAIANIYSTSQNLYRQLVIAVRFGVKGFIIGNISE